MLEVLAPDRIQIFRVFQADRDANKPSVNSQLIFLVFRYYGVSQGIWMLNKAFHASKADCEVEITGRCQNAFDACQVSRDFDRNDTAKLII